MSYGIIKNHHGEIRVESKVGVGTTFTIELPRYNSERNRQGNLTAENAGGAELKK